MAQNDVKEAWARAPRWSKTCLGAAGRASARGPDTRAGVPEGPLKACRAPEAPRGAGGWALGSSARPARPGAAGLPGESGGLHLLDELHLLTPRPFCRRPRRWAPARSEPGAQIKGRVQGPLQVPGGLRGVQGFPPLFLGRLVPLLVPEEAGRRRGSACSGEAFWLHLHRLSRSGPRSGATSWRRKEERERGIITGKEKCFFLNVFLQPEESGVPQIFGTSKRITITGSQAYVKYFCLDMSQVQSTLPCIANSSKEPGESRNPGHTFMGLASPIFAQLHDSLKNEHSLLTFGF
ncbi:uncharacterized protein LOC123379081 [Felis catus]|uniref:uncharacterized protein LOC123379081 n=1 Tax=Felis catus TaxID=9685 RepID=UPI001D19DC24|nr:uncharacterized protein LOC123379081 [Felis catus]